LDAFENDIFVEASQEPFAFLLAVSVWMIMAWF